MWTLWRLDPYVSANGEAVVLDPDAIKRQERYDGKSVLRATTRLSGEAIVKAYRQLYRVERTFRELKGPFELRPVDHDVDRRIRGRVMVCFLSYVLEMALRQALGGGKAVSEADDHAVREGLGRLGAGEVTARRGGTCCARR